MKLPVLGCEVCSTILACSRISNQYNTLVGWWRRAISLAGINSLSAVTYGLVQHNQRIPSRPNKNLDTASHVGRNKRAG